MSLRSLITKLERIGRRNWPCPSNTSERGTKHAFPVNLAQIRSTVPEIFHIQRKKVTDSAKHRTLRSSLRAVTRVVNIIQNLISTSHNRASCQISTWKSTDIVGYSVGNYAYRGLHVTKVNAHCSVHILRCNSYMRIYLYFLGRLRPSNIRGGNVRPSVGTSVRPSTKSLPDFNEIWYVRRGRWVMHDGMPYDPIQGQGQGHGASEVPKIALFKVFSSAIYRGSWQMTTNY